MLTDYFEKKKDRLSHATVAAVLRLDGAPAAAAPALARYAGAARSEFLRLEASQLLLGLLRPPRVRTLPGFFCNYVYHHQYPKAGAVSKVPDAGCCAGDAR